MGEEHELKGLGSMGRRPPFIGTPESNRYVLSPHTSGTSARVAVTGKREQRLETLGGSAAEAVLPLIRAVLPRGSRTQEQRWQGRAERDDSTAVAILPPDRGGTTAYRWYCRTTVLPYYR